MNVRLLGLGQHTFGVAQFLFSYQQDGIRLSGDFGYQFNHRAEWSSFHTHYDTQVMSEKDLDKELVFKLHTFSSSLRLRLLNSSSWEHTAGWDVQIQKNTIAGYSFLLPTYRRFTTGGFWFTKFCSGDRISITGGIRYDSGKVDITAYNDPCLVEYLRGQGYEEEVIGAYQWRSYPVNRAFGDYSGSVGMVWTPSSNHLLKLNIGRSFRLPGANELASNGVHRGTFWYEKGDASLSSERGWQIDASYTLTGKGMELDVSGLKNAKIHHHDIVIPADAAPGDYHLVVWCTDAAGNQTEVARNIVLSN